VKLPVAGSQWARAGKNAARAPITKGKALKVFNKTLSTRSMQAMLPEAGGVGQPCQQVECAVVQV